MKKTLIAVAALAVSGTAVAGPSWTYLDAGYMRASSEGNNSDTEGYMLRGSFGLDQFHGRLEWNDGELDGGNGSGGEDTDGYKIVLGAHPAVTDNTDLVFEISYFDQDYDFGGSGSGSADGYGLGVGVRSMITDNLELSAGVETTSGDYADAGDPGDDFTDVAVTAGGQYLFTDNIGTGVDVSIGGNSDFSGNSANWYVRWSF